MAQTIKLHTVGKMTGAEARACADQYRREGRICGGCQYQSGCGIVEFIRKRNQEMRRHLAERMVSVTL